MDKRTLLAMLIIFAAVLFFNSELYYHHILRRPTPSEVIRKQQIVKLQERRAREEARDSLPADTTTLTTRIPIADASPLPQLRSAPEKTPDEIPELATIAVLAPPVIVETPLYICTIDRQGARIVSWKMKNFQPFNAPSGDSIAELLLEGTVGAVSLSLGGTNYDSIPFTCMQMDTLVSHKILDTDETCKLTFLARGPNGTELEKEFRFRGNEWRTGLTVRKRNTGVEKLKIAWPEGLRCVDRDPQKDPDGRSGPGGFDGFLLWGDEVEKADDFEKGRREYPGAVRWAALKEGYFGCALILDTTRDATVEFTQSKEGKAVVHMGFALEEDFESEELHYEMFMGPMRHSLLKSYDLMLERTIFGGYAWFFRADIWFPSLCGLVLWLLNFFYRLIPDYGASILLLTLLSRLVTIPLTHKSQKSMSAMKDLQPKMNEIRAKYKAEPAKMNAEIMKLYKKHGVSPLGAGCLPMLLQMPVFISLFVSLRRAVELRGTQTALFPWVTDLSRPDAIFGLPVNIPMYGSQVCVFPIVMAVATFFQNKMTIKDPNQKMMVYFMPIFFLALFNSFPAGLNLYWTFSTIIGIVQQLIVERMKKAKAPVPAKA